MMLNKMYSLPEIRFVGGSSENLKFNLYYDENSPKPFNFFGGEANFSIVNFINKNSTPLVSKRMTINLNEAETHYNVLHVSLEPTDTVDLFGKFVYQITLKDIDGNVDIPHQGIINIHSNIDKAFTKRKTN